MSLKLVQNVEKLHRGKKHIDTLIDRLDDVIRDYADECKSRDNGVTYAEVIGTLTVLINDYMNERR